MTFHFVNLVSWNTFRHLDKKVIIYADSVSFRFTASIFGIHLEKMSGVSFKDSINFEETDIVLAARQGNWGGAFTYVLPLGMNLSSQEITKINEVIGPYKRVFIGISSPKQDLLAFRLHSDNQDKQIYCLGAALYTEGTGHSFLWFRMLVKNPIRGFKKIALTALNLMRIIFIESERQDFVSLLRRIKDERNSYF